ncbi:MAG: hypothetical protein IPF99_31370 [Deltaproteobacteria bacterium]|nr:hypothetical protein [Deltaproteobacteria bacterium]
MRRFVNDVTGAAASNPGSSALGATAWMVWPASMFAVTDERVARQMRSDMERVLAALRGDPGTEGGAYLTKTMLAAAVFVGRGGDPTLRPLVEESLVRMARDVITDDTQVMGEVVFITLRDADGGVTARRTGCPSPPVEATLFYLTTMALSEPTRFDFDRRALPAAMTPLPGTVPLPEPMADAGAVMDATVDAPQVFDAGAVMDAGRDPFALRTTGGDCACAVPGPARLGGARGWMALGALGLWAARRRRRRA